ncbi:MAG: glycerophosphodiester phosphodiesterase family protein [Oscillospiraceae bacterium]|nr:glycerophosphodiester phosphodiesterase family protein [Oscillospiraceae bacterium]
MVNIWKKTAIFILSFILFTALSVSSAIAADASDIASDFSDGKKNIICIAHRGDWHSFPENSAEAINAAAEYDAVSVDIRLTADGKPVLMADEKVDRMSVDSEGKSVSGKVSSFTLAQLKELYLRESNGGTDKKKTTCRIPELKEIYETAAGRTAVMLNVQENDFKTVYDYVKSLGKLDETVFRINAKPKKIIELTRDLDGVNVTGNYQGNIIFLATSAVKKYFAANIYTIEMGSTNGNGVLYDNFLMKRFVGSKRAMVSMVNGRCGKRADNEAGWDDLISRGYSVIETDFPAELTEYIRKTETAATNLEKNIDIYANTDLSPYTSETEKAFSSALSAAKKTLDGKSSFSELTDARSALQSAHDSLKVGAKKNVALKFRFTPGRIIAVVLCAAAFTGGTLFLRSKRESTA